MDGCGVVGLLSRRSWCLVLKALSYVELYDLVRTSKELNRFLLGTKLRNEVMLASPVDALATWIGNDTWEERFNCLCYTDRLIFRRFFRMNAALAAARAGDVSFFSRLVDAERSVRLPKSVVKFDTPVPYGGHESVLYRVFELGTSRNTKQNVLLGADAVVEAFNHGRLECLKQMKLLGVIRYEDVSFSFHSLMDNPLPLGVEESCLNFLFECVSPKYFNVALWRAAKRDDVITWLRWALKSPPDNTSGSLTASCAVSFASQEMMKRLVLKGDIVGLSSMIATSPENDQIERRGLVLVTSTAEYLTCLAAREETPCALRKLVSVGCSVSGSAALEAAKYGRAECLKFVVENRNYLSMRESAWVGGGYIIGGETPCVCSVSASNGRLTCLVYALENGCKHCSSLCRKAAENGHLECLRYLYESHVSRQPGEKGSAPHLWDKGVCFASAANGHLNCLRYAHENGCPWDAAVCAAAAQHGHLHCLRYARESGCPWDERTCTSAAKKGHLHCLRYAHENGCEWARYTIEESLLEYKRVSDDLAEHKRGTVFRLSGFPESGPKDRWTERRHECVFCFPQRDCGQSSGAGESGVVKQPCNTRPSQNTSLNGKNDGADKRSRSHDPRPQDKSEQSTVPAEEQALLLQRLESCLKYLAEEGALRHLPGEQDVLTSVVSGENCGFVTELIERVGLVPTEATLKRAAEKGNAELLCYLLERAQDTSARASLLVECCEAAAENGCFDRMVLLDTFFARFCAKTGTGDTFSQTTANDCSEKGVFETGSSFKVLLKAVQNNHKKCFCYAFRGKKNLFAQEEAENLAKELVFREWYEEFDRLVSLCGFDLRFYPQNLLQLLESRNPGPFGCLGSMRLKKVVGCMKTWWVVDFCESAVLRGLIPAFFCAAQNGAPCNSQVRLVAEQREEEEVLEYLEWHWKGKPERCPRTTGAGETSEGDAGTAGKVRSCVLLENKAQQQDTQGSGPNAAPATRPCLAGESACTETAGCGAQQVADDARPTSGTTPAEPVVAVPDLRPCFTPSFGYAYKKSMRRFFGAPH